MPSHKIEILYYLYVIMCTANCLNIIYDLLNILKKKHILNINLWYTTNTL